MKRSDGPTSRVRSPALAEARYLLGLHRLTLRARPVLVYTMGKVGSTALSEAIDEVPGYIALHFHSLRRTRGQPGGEMRPRGLTRRRTRPAWNGDYARLRLAADRRSQWKVVAGVRDPLARLVSAFFQVGERRGYLDPAASLSRTAFDALVDAFVDQAMWGLQRDWFVDELKRTTGIDVYASGFPADKGYELYESPRFRVAVIRFEDLERVGSLALAELLAAGSPPQLPRANVGSAKRYGQLYARFIDEAKLPRSLIDRAYGSRVARHFYTKAEIDSMRRRWES